MINIVVAMGMNNEIGKDNNLLCHLKDDLLNFRYLTEGNTVVMGRKTYESIGKPLPERINIVLTRDEDAENNLPDNVMLDSFEDVLKINQQYPALPIFVIGGGEIYKQFLPYTSRVYLTRILNKFEADTFFPELDVSRWQVVQERYYKASESNDYPFYISVLERSV